MTRSKIQDRDFVVSLTLPSINQEVHDYVNVKAAKLAHYVGNPFTEKVENWLMPYVVRQCDEGRNESFLENREVILVVSVTGFCKVVRSWKIDTLKVIYATSKRSKIENPVRAFLYVLEILVFQILDEASMIMFKGSSGIKKEWKDMGDLKAEELQYN